MIWSLPSNVPPGLQEGLWGTRHQQARRVHSTSSETRGNKHSAPWDANPADVITCRIPFPWHVPSTPLQNACPIWNQMSNSGLSCFVLAPCLFSSVHTKYSCLLTCTRPSSPVRKSPPWQRPSYVFKSLFFLCPAQVQCLAFWRCAIFFWTDRWLGWPTKPAASDYMQ